MHTVYVWSTFPTSEMKSATDIKTVLTYPSLILSFQVVFYFEKFGTIFKKEGDTRNYFCIMYGRITIRRRQAYIN